jgi:glutamate racemase
LLAEGADTIVLGCTHYPFVRDLISDVVGKDIVLVETGLAVASQLKNRLIEAGLLCASQSVGEVKFWTNSTAENAAQVIENLWGERAEIKAF